MRAISCPAAVLLLACLARPGAAGMMGWLFAADPPDPPPGGSAAAPDPEDGARQVPFETLSADDKFLAAVKRSAPMEMSELDTCQHKIFLSLHQSCSRLSEEDMAKVAVQLLNCQSQSEARPVHPCTSDMTIAACTRHMDAHTWNAYHIVSNRARAVCYAARQQQFRAATELAVNRLAAQTFRQLERMAQLEGSQAQLERMTADTLDRVARGQADLLTQHGKLSSAQASIHSNVVDNLRELGRVRSAISVGQAGVSHTLEQIRAGLEGAAAELRSQQAARNASQLRLTADLERIHDSALQLLTRLESVDSTTQAVMGRFDHLLASLERMNGTIFTLLSTLEATQRQVDLKLGWLVDLLGSDLHRVTTVLLHLGFLLLAMLLLVFLQAPGAVRLALLLTVPANLLSALQAGPALDFSAITTLLVTVGVAHYLAVWLYGRWYGRQSVKSQSPLPLRSKSAEELQQNGGHIHPTPLSRASTRDVNTSDSEEEQEGPAEVSRVGSLLNGITGRTRTPLNRPEFPADVQFCLHPSTLHLIS